MKTMTTKKKPKRTDLTHEARLGDCVKLLLTQKLAQRPKLAIADPPYDFGMPYEAHADRMGYDKYMAWMRAWTSAVYDVLDKHGSFWIFTPEEWETEIDMHCRHNLGLFKRRRITWAFTFGQKAIKNFTRSTCSLLYYSKTKSVFTFNEDAVKVPSARQLVYNDKRAVAGGKPPDSTWMLLKEQMDPYMGFDRDIWLVSRICGTFKARKKHSPNQIPLPIMERIIASTSNPGDLVLDPFCGTGSSGKAAVRLGRSWLGFDIGKTCVQESNKEIAVERIAAGLD